MILDGPVEEEEEENDEGDDGGSDCTSLESCCKLLHQAKHRWLCKTRT